MFIKKRPLVLIFTLIFIMTAFTGCKSNATSSTKSDKNATPTAAPTSAPTLTPKPIDYEKATLKDVYSDYFTIGNILNYSTFNDEKCIDIVKANFNSITCENEMKPDSLLDLRKCITEPEKYDENPAVDFQRADPILKFAKDNGIKMRGHTLVWYSQTPRALFAENYSVNQNAPLVSRDKMLVRMENYIKNVIEYANTNYPGVIYAWDVVNEAINVDDGEKDGLRTKNNLWYEVVGPDYIEKAFEFARKYASKDQKLFYNDYSTADKIKCTYITELLSKLKDKGLIDGIGMQSHNTLNSPTIMDIDTTTREYAKLGLEIQVTELDMAMNTNTEEDLQKQATSYKRLFLFFKKWKDQGINITNVTFWGITDDQSWLNNMNGDTEYPLLFDRDYKKKPAFYGVLQDPKIPLY